MTISKHLVSIGDVSYDVLNIPNLKSPIVLASVDQTLKNLSIETLVQNLDRVNQLLYLAYTGVSEHGDLRALVSTIQYELLKLCSSADITMVVINSSAKVIIKNVNKCVQALYEGEEALALRFLKRCSKHASNMAKESHKLSAGFTELADKTNTSLGKTMDAQGTDIADRKKVEARIAEIEANNAEATKIQGKLGSSIEEMKKRVEDAKEQKEKAGDRAFGLAIGGMITGAIGQGVGAAAAIYGQSTTPNINLNQTGAPAQQQPAAPASVDDENDEDENEDTDEDENDADDSVKAAEGDDAENTEEVESAKSEMRKRKLMAAKGLSEAANKVGNDAQKMSGSYEDIAEGYRQEQMKYLDIQLAMEKQQRELLGSVAKYARLLSERNEEKETLSKTIMALQQAIGALKQIATALEAAGHFWEVMSKKCDSISDSSMVDDVQDYMDLLPLEKRVAKYNSDEFKGEIITYYANWQALRIIATRYGKAVELAHSEVKVNYEKNPTPEESKDLAVELGKKLLSAAERDLHALSVSSSENEEQRKALGAP